MKNKRFFICTLAIVLVTIFGQTFFALADGPLSGALGKLQTVNANTKLESDLPTTIGNVIKTVLGLVGTIFFVLTIYSGILWMTAMGNSEQIDKSRAIITAAIIGLAITLSAYAITYFIGNRLGNATNPAGNAPVPCAGRCVAVPGDCVSPATINNAHSCTNNNAGTLCCE